VYAVHYSTAALKALRKMPSQNAGRIRAKIKELADNPFEMAGVKKLTNHPGYRLRVGDWRVLYLVDQGRLIILLTEIAQRKEVYR
jgi:mRNA interferase RelE/StbE